MLSLLFIHFLAFPAYGKFSVINQAFTDPMVFAQSFSSASPKQINNVIAIINGLITDGEAKNDSIVAAHNDALDAQATAVKNEKLALTAFETARGEREVFAGVVEDTKELLAKNKDAQKAALDAFNLATEKKNTAQAWMEKEVERINKEKEILEGVIVTLNSLPPSLIGTQRNLLRVQSHLAPVMPAMPALIEAAKVNPDSVAKIVAMVNGLIAEGEAARTKVIGDRDQAEAVRVNKEKAYNAAVATTLATQKRLDDEKKKLASLVEVETAAEVAWKSTVDILNAANDDEAVKRKEMETQVPILNKEDQQLQKVVTILTEMLQKKD